MRDQFVVNYFKSSLRYNRGKTQMTITAAAVPTELARTSNTSDLRVIVKKA